MVRTLADAVAATLRSRAHALERGTAVNEDLRHEEFAFFGLAIVLFFPVGDCRTQQQLNGVRSSLLAETKRAEGAIHLHTANHVNDIAHLAGRGGAIVQFGKILGFESRLARFGGKSFSCSHYLEIEILFWIVVVAFTRSFYFFLLPP